MLNEKDLREAYIWNLKVDRVEAYVGIFMSFLMGIALFNILPNGDKWWTLMISLITGVLISAVRKYSRLIKENTSDAIMEKQE